MTSDEGKIARGLRVNSVGVAHPSHPLPGPVRRNNSYHVPPRNSEIRPSEDLLQTALRRGMTRGNSSSRIDTLGGGPKSKNIPMVATSTISRLGELRWGTYSLDQPENPNITEKNDKAPEAENKTAQKASISPLTHMHEPTAGGRNAASTGPSRDASYANSRTNSRSSLVDTGVERSSSNFDKRSELGSTFSIAPVGRSNSDVTFSGDDRNSKKSSRSKLTVHSDDDELRYEENFEDAYLQVPGLANATSVLDFLKSVDDGAEKKTDLQNKPEFRIKSRSNSMSAKAGLDNSSRPVTRTHQKVLDLKTLLLHEKAEVANPGTHASQLQDYASRIQHESIVSQWTQIRLRFSGRPDVKHPKQNPSSRAGILGSVQRQHEREKRSVPKKDTDTYLEHFSVTKDNADGYLREMWNNASYEMGEVGEMGETHWSDQAESLGPSSPQSIPQYIPETSQNQVFAEMPDMQTMARSALTSRI